jgi:hypothetical protein
MLEGILNSSLGGLIGVLLGSVGSAFFTSLLLPHATIPKVSLQARIIINPDPHARAMNLLANVHTKTELERLEVKLKKLQDQTSLTKKGEKGKS